MEEERYYAEYEIDLREYIMLLWNAKWFIIGLFIIAVVGAGIFSQFYLTPTYETEATIYAPDFELLNGESLRQNDYLPFLKKANIADEIINKYNLDEEDENITSQNLIKKIEFSKVSDSKLVNISFTGTKSNQITKILDTWVALFEQDTYKYINETNSRYLNDLESNKFSKKENFLKKRNKISIFNEETNLSLMKSKLNNLENRLIRVEENINNLEKNISTNNSRLDEINIQLSETDKFLITEEVISDSTLKKLKQLLDKYENLEQLNNVNSKKETLNPTFVDLIRIKNNINQSLKSDKKELDILKSNTKKIESDIKELQVEIANKKEEIDKLEQELEIARKNYQLAEEQYSKAEQELSAKNYQINVINSPVIPNNPVSPNKKLNIAIAGVLSLMLGVFIIFFKEFLKEEK